ncbi:flagellar associated protein [Angomonas deanei]|uniref:Cilia- and flagella-associated protein 58 central coiled coil domain-containing protein n=1 Tax=Angomonas deanei TaxID=59799 RepID=A0A7G2C198_9TRYP|nr:flagellar associated protein [Angomonas deanei]CAD2213084.1 hypothetical protein, conserved [Angomonas deanei]|eukprot:EPY39086.1 flagellar associated protein [Angomonas deanei]
MKREKLRSMLEQEDKNLLEIEEDIKREEQIGLRLKSQIETLEKERERYVAEVSQVGIQQGSAKDELKMTEIAVEELQKKIEEKEAKINEQQSEYEKIRAERNQFSKKLVEAQDEIVELKQKFKLMDHQISQFKEELQMKDKKYVEENAKQKAVKERLAKTRKTVNDYAAKFEEHRTASDTVQQQIKQLVKVITVFDKELSDKQKDVFKLTTERDTLGTQLIRRNDELALLYEKLRIQQDTASNGEAGLRARMDDIRILKLKTAEVKRQALLATNKASKINELKENINNIERELEAEKAKATALAEELENPNNTTRWRKIEGKDLSQEELETKLSTLQKRLITKSEESLEQEIALQEKERLVTELQAILSRQPGPQVAAKLNSYHKDLQKRNARMKQKASELNMTSTHIEELKYEAERLRRELHDTKRKYYEMKMKNDLLLNPRRAVTPPAEASRM